MSWADAVTAAGTSLLATFGEAVTYYPATGGSFSCSAVIDPVEVDQLDRSVVRDFSTAQILHATLEDNSVTEPTTYMERQTGDQIKTTDPNGSTLTWKVVDKLFDNGIWTLTLEKNVRISP
jgi:hypothetical protein